MRATPDGAGAGAVRGVSNLVPERRQGVVLCCAM